MENLLCFFSFLVYYTIFPLLLEEKGVRGVRSNCLLLFDSTPILCDFLNPSDLKKFLIFFVDIITSKIFSLLEVDVPMPRWWNW